MVEMFERLTHLAEQALGKIKVSSALNPVLWLAALTIPLGLWTATSANLILQIAGLAVVFSTITLFAIGFLYFMIKSPEKLRSEEYELRKLALELVEEKGGRIAIAQTSVEAISNVDYRASSKLQIEGPES
jgi:hypothetical protein